MVMGTIKVQASDVFKCGLHRIIENCHSFHHPVIFPSLPIAEIWSDEVSHNPICSEYPGKSVTSDGLEHRFPLGILKPEMLVTRYGISPIQGYRATVLSAVTDGFNQEPEHCERFHACHILAEYTQGPAGLRLPPGWHEQSECRWIEPVAEIMTALDHQLQSVNTDECLKYMLECFQHLSLMSYLGCNFFFF